MPLGAIHVQLSEATPSGSIDGPSVTIRGGLFCFETQEAIEKWLAGALNRYYEKRLEEIYARNFAPGGGRYLGVLGKDGLPKVEGKE